jgi:hypothetical protein
MITTTSPLLSPYRGGSLQLPWRRFFVELGGFGGAHPVPHGLVDMGGVLGWWAAGGVGGDLALDVAGFPWCDQPVRPEAGEVVVAEIARMVKGALRAFIVG